ncbi:MAG TPA: hydroxymethylbilane synthase [Candidatus Dormibacteraeota bacterium]|nr:hydroxymethylbilane synthase [Candidatus Dormibacteraeota bacterium]
MTTGALAVTRALRIATRGSALARAQTELAVSLLQRVAHVQTEVFVVHSGGDRSPDIPAALMEGQGWFTAELEQAVLDGRADAAVHSAKDLPTQLADGLTVVAYLPRADARDALVARDGLALADLPAGASVGTSSPRREAFLRALRPDLRVLPMRGNVDTRLRKLDGGEVDAVLLAAAGLDRLGLGERASERLDPHRFVPSPAQGVIAVEARVDSTASAACALADDAVSRAVVRAEREVLRRLGAGCRLPLGAWARVEEGRLVLLGALAGEDGVVRRAELGGDVAEPLALGAEVAARLGAA